MEQQLTDEEKVIKEAERLILVNATQNLRRAQKEYDKAFLIGLGIHVQRKYGTMSPKLLDIAGLTEPPEQCSCDKDGNGNRIRWNQAGHRCRYHIIEDIE